MLNLFFKNVGQGDSIIIEWQNGFGIVDANLYNGTNPSLSHLTSSKLKIINFIILSHPHTDHFSGMREVLEYCESNDILIENFLFTGRISIQHVKDSVFGIDAQTELSKLFATIHRLHKAEKIKFVSNVSANYKFNLTEELTLEFLAPSYSEVEEYEKSTMKNYIKGTINNPKANNISSVIRISNQNQYILLTSDAPKFVFGHILRRDTAYKTKQIILGQVPHHGSKDNYNEAFWKRISNTEKPAAVISVGSGYNHPDKIVIDAFNKLNYEIYSTNFVGGLKEVYSIGSTVKDTSVLDHFSTLRSIKSRNSNTRFLGDKVFSFDSSFKFK